MRFHVILFLIYLQALAVSALHIRFKQSKRLLSHRSTQTSVTVIRPGSVLAGSNVLAAGGTDGNNGLDITTVQDLIYVANATVGGVDYPLQLDTGSSDLWIKGTSSPLPNTQSTTTSCNITYGIGWAFGYVSYASAQFAGISVQSQAFLDVSAADNPALSYGAQGILGLGFTSLSTIDALVNRSGTSTGRSLLYNLFSANPSQPNFIAFALQRSTDANGEVDGSFSIGEYVTEYAGIANTPAIPTWPRHAPTRWNVLLDSFIVNGQTVPVSSAVPGAPSNQAIVLLDSGTSYTYAPQAVCDAIYKDVAGARFDQSLGQWIVPCDFEIDMAIQVSGRVFPLHPLDLTPHGFSDPSTCVGSFVPQTITVGGSQFDWLIGDNFLRSVYSIYDFGDFDSSGAMGDPYVKLLSIIDPDEASRDFHAIRGGTPKSNITYNVSKSSSTDPSTTNITLSNQVAMGLAKLGTYLPIMLGILALNALVLIALVVVGIFLLCRRKASPKTRKRRSRMSDPLKLDDMPINFTTSTAGDNPIPPSHAYHPVSMAMTEDTVFMPSASLESPRRKGDRDSAMVNPTTGILGEESVITSTSYHSIPATNTDDVVTGRGQHDPTRRNWNPDSLTPLPPSDRPRTAIFTGPPIRTSQRTLMGNAEETGFAPPSPGFWMVEHDRPRSIA